MKIDSLEQKVGDAQSRIPILRAFISKFKRSDFIPGYGVVTTIYEFLKSTFKSGRNEVMPNYIRTMLILSYNQLVLSGVTIVSGLFYNNLLKN